MGVGKAMSQVTTHALVSVNIKVNRTRARQFELKKSICTGQDSVAQGETSCRYSFYLLCWHRSTNTDANCAPAARAQKNKKDAGKEKTEKNEKTEAEGPTEELFCCGHNGFFFLAFANAKQASSLRPHTLVA